MAPPTVLIVGGGFAGVTFAKGATAAGASCIIVDPKNFFDVKFASLRAVVLPEGPVAKEHVWEYAKIPGIGRVIQGKVQTLTKNSAVLESGEEIKFDWAVLATGSTNAAGVYAQPQSTDIAGRRAEIKATSELIKAAKSVAIIGAGFVGVELAAEIAEAYAGKKITLVCSTAKLFENKSPKLGNSAAQWFKSNNVEVVYNEKATKKSETSVVLKSGKDLTADLVIWTVGAKPNTAFLKSSELASKLDESDRVKVTPSLRVEEFDNIFCLGDINNVKEEKLGYLAVLQAELAVKNFTALLKSKDAKLKAWVPFNGTPAAFITLGSGGGTGHLGNCVVPSCMVGMMKSKNLFVSKFRDQWSVKA